METVCSQGRTHTVGGRVSCGLFHVPSAWSRGTTADRQAACPLRVSVVTTSSVKSSGGGGSWLLCRRCTCLSVPPAPSVHSRPYKPIFLPHVSS